MRSDARFHGVSPVKFNHHNEEKLLIVLGTLSSESVLPRIMVAMENMGARESVLGLVIPSGHSFNLDGESICLTMVNDGLDGVPG